MIDSLVKGFEEIVLNYYLFEGDETDIVVLRNKWVDTRKPHVCVICQGEIPDQSRVRMQSEVNREESRVMNFYVCRTCCFSIFRLCIGIDAEDYKALEERYSLGAERARNEV